MKSASCDIGIENLETCWASDKLHHLNAKKEWALEQTFWWGWCAGVYKCTTLNNGVLEPSKHGRRCEELRLLGLALGHRSWRIGTIPVAYWSYKSGHSEIKILWLIRCKRCTVEIGDLHRYDLPGPIFFWLLLFICQTSLETNGYIWCIFDNHNYLHR